MRISHGTWAEYDAAAEWCAARGLTGKPGDPLPKMLAHITVWRINHDPEAFARRVRECAYARAREKRMP
jgi:hypothetical protein